MDNQTNLYQFSDQQAFRQADQQPETDSQLLEPSKYSQQKPPVSKTGKKAAIASMILGILSFAGCGFSSFITFSFSSVVSVILGILGIIFAIVASGRGYKGACRTIGLIFSIIGLVEGAAALFFTISSVKLIFPEFGIDSSIV